MSQIFADFKIIIPNVSFNNLDMIFAFSALIQIRTFLTFRRVALILSFSFSV